MGEITKETQQKKHECKFYLSLQSKQKISSLARELKINQSELVDKLIMDLDETKQIISNIEYVKSREEIFSQMAKEVFGLKEAQKKYLEDVKNIKDELASVTKLIPSFKSYLDRRFLEIRNSKPVGLIQEITQKLSGKDK